MRNLWLIALATLVGCSSEVRPPPDVRLLVGQESETWSAEPLPTRVQVEFVSTEGRKVIGQTNAPAQTVTIQNPGVKSGTVGTFEVTGFDAVDTPLVRGASVPYVLYDLASATIPIFVARAATWSRPAENLEHTRNRPVVTVLWHQYILAAGGEVKDLNPAIPDIYDAINWRPVPTQPAFPRTPKSMVIVGTTLLCIDEMGAAWVDLYDDRVNTATPPMGLTFAEVAGGDVFELGDGTSYVVGATRAAGDPTSKVLRVDKNGYFRAVTLSSARRGAAAGVVAGNLVVWGGSAEAAGAEVLTKAQDAFSALPFAPDAAVGVGLATFDGATAILAGGKDPMTGAAAAWRTFDVTCGADCAAAELAMPPVALDRTRVFRLAAGNVMVTGETDDGELHAFGLVTSSGTPEITERPLRERRKGGTSLLLPNGQPGVLGGENPETAAPILSLETFFF